MGDSGSADGEVEQLIRQRYGQVVRAVAMMCSSATVAEDATQEASIRALARLRDGEEIANLSGWVVVTAANIARDIRRRHDAETRATARLGTRTEGAEDDPSTAAEHAELRERVRRLPERQRQVAVLHYLLGMSVADIAETLETTPGNVKNALFRARASLAKALHVDEGVG